MTMSLLRRFGRFAALLSLAPLALAACNDDGPTNPTGQQQVVEVILNSVDNSLTVVPAQGPAPATARTIELGAQGTPVGFAINGTRAVVPMGTYPFAAVVNLTTGTVERYAPLPANSGATGAAFLDNNTAVVANPGRNSVVAIDLATGVVGVEVPVRQYPQAITVGLNRVFVINANLVNFAPAGTGSVTVLSNSLQLIENVDLSGRNSAAAVLVGTRLYVLNSGDFGQNNGTLSVVNTLTFEEEQLVTGFGEFPGSIALGPDGNLYVGVYGTGVLVWNPNTQSFVRGLNNPLVPGGSPPVSAVAFDPAGKLHTANPGACQAAGVAHRLSGATVERTVATGVCPFYIGFGTAPAAN